MLAAVFYDAFRESDRVDVGLDQGGIEFLGCPLIRGGLLSRNYLG